CRRSREGIEAVVFLKGPISVSKADTRVYRRDNVIRASSDGRIRWYTFGNIRVELVRHARGVTGSVSEWQGSVEGSVIYLGCICLGDVSRLSAVVGGAGCLWYREAQGNIWGRRIIIVPVGLLI